MFENLIQQALINCVTSLGDIIFDSITSSLAIAFCCVGLVYLFPQATITKLMLFFVSASAVPKIITFVDEKKQQAQEQVVKLEQEAEVQIENIKLELDYLKNDTFQKTEEFFEESADYIETKKNVVVDKSSSLRDELDFFRKTYDKKYYESERSKARWQMFWSVLLWPINNIFFVVQTALFVALLVFIGHNWSRIKNAYNKAKNLLFPPKNFGDNNGGKGGNAGRDDLEQLFKEGNRNGGNNLILNEGGDNSPISHEGGDSGSGSNIGMEEMIVNPYLACEPKKAVEVKTKNNTSTYNMYFHKYYKDSVISAMHAQRAMRIDASDDYSDQDLAKFLIAKGKVLLKNEKLYPGFENYPQFVSEKETQRIELAQKLEQEMDSEVLKQQEAKRKEEEEIRVVEYLKYLERLDKQVTQRRKQDEEELLRRLCREALEKQKKERKEAKAKAISEMQKQRRDEALIKLKENHVPFSREKEQVDLNKNKAKQQANLDALNKQEQDELDKLKEDQRRRHAAAQEKRAGHLANLKLSKEENARLQGLLASHRNRKNEEEEEEEEEAIALKERIENFNFIQKKRREHLCTLKQKESVLTRICSYLDYCLPKPKQKGKLSKNKAKQQANLDALNKQEQEELDKLKEDQRRRHAAAEEKVREDRLAIYKISHEENARRQGILASYKVRKNKEKQEEKRRRDLEEMKAVTEELLSLMKEILKIREALKFYTKSKLINFEALEEGIFLSNRSVEELKKRKKDGLYNFDLKKEKGFIILGQKSLENYTSLLKEVREEEAKRLSEEKTKTEEEQRRASLNEFLKIQRETLSVNEEILAYSHLLSQINLDILKRNITNITNSISEHELALKEKTYLTSWFNYKGFIEAGMQLLEQNKVTLQRLKEEQLKKELERDLEEMKAVTEELLSLSKEILKIKEALKFYTKSKLINFKILEKNILIYRRNIALYEKRKKDENYNFVLKEEKGKIILFKKSLENTSKLLKQVEEEAKRVSEEEPKTEVDVLVEKNKLPVSIALVLGGSPNLDASYGNPYGNSYSNYYTGRKEYYNNFYNEAYEEREEKRDLEESELTPVSSSSLDTKKAKGVWMAATTKTKDGVYRNNNNSSSSKHQSKSSSPKGKINNKGSGGARPCRSKAMPLADQDDKSWNPQKPTQDTTLIDDLIKTLPVQGGKKIGSELAKKTVKEVVVKKLGKEAIKTMAKDMTSSAGVEGAKSTLGVATTELVDYTTKPMSVWEAWSRSQPEVRLFTEVSLSKTVDSAKEGLKSAEKEYAKKLTENVVKFTSDATESYTKELSEAAVKNAKKTVTASALGSVVGSVGMSAVMDTVISVGGTLINKAKGKEKRDLGQAIIEDLPPPKEYFKNALSSTITASIMGISLFTPVGWLGCVGYLAGSVALGVATKKVVSLTYDTIETEIKTKLA